MENAPRIACVTGASGMIGSQIVQKLLASGYRVRALSRGSGFDSAVVDWRRGDLTDEGMLEKFLQNASILLHCAAELKDTTKMWAVNVRATERLLHLAHQAGVKYLCYLSSAGVVGKTDQTWVDETVSCNPHNPYERSKWQAEDLVKQCNGSFRVVILRPTNVIDEANPGALALPMRSSWADRLALMIKGEAAAALYFIDHPTASPAWYFVSYDGDPRNSLAGLWALYSACKENRPLDLLVPKFHLPLIVPYLMRRLLRGQGNKGDVRYSAKRLLSAGFTFPLGLTGAVKQIMLRTASAQT